MAGRCCGRSRPASRSGGATSLSTRRRPPCGCAARWSRLSRGSARPPSEEAEDLGVIRGARQGGLRRFPQAQGGLQIRRLNAEVAREACRDADILRHQRELESRCESAGQYLLRNLALGGAVAPGGRVDRFEHRLRLETEGLRNQQRLEAREGAGCAEVIVQRLDRVSGPDRTD